jgi:dihydroorotate dehydrogenase (fumarate)
MQVSVSPVETGTASRHPRGVDVDLSTPYLGLPLKSPLVASSSPLTGNLDSLRALEEAGAAAVVLPSLFEEEVGEEPAGPLELPESYAELLAGAKSSLSIPVIASLNGTTAGGWLRLSELIQQAGADAIELNVYAVETDRYTSGAAVEDRTLRIVHRVKSTVRIPVAVKVSPFYTAFAHMADRLVDARADGIVLFNRFLQPDIDLESLTVVPRLKLSCSDEVRLTLRWIAIIRGRIQCSLGATGGVHDVEDILKLIAAGADAVMLASVLLERGWGAVEELTGELRDWLAAHDYPSVAAFRGIVTQAAVPNPAAFERAQYIAALEAGV